MVHIRLPESHGYNDENFVFAAQKMKMHYVERLTNMYTCCIHINFIMGYGLLVQIY